MDDSPQGNELEPLRPGSVVRQGPKSGARYTPSVKKDVVPVTRPEDEYSAISSELIDLANRKQPEKKLTENSKPTQGSVLAAIAISALHLSFALGGFFFLKTFALAMLWFLFLLVVYPILLVFAARADTLPHGDLVALYKVGVSQIPAIGKMLASAFNSKKTIKACWSLFAVLPSGGVAR